MPTIGDMTPDEYFETQAEREMSEARKTYTFGHTLTEDSIIFLKDRYINAATLAALIAGAATLAALIAGQGVVIYPENFNAILTHARDRGEPVAWRVKDFADGWILCHSEREAKDLAKDADNLIEPLYR